MSFEPKPETDSHVDLLRRTLALTWACTLGNKDCIDNSKEQFKAYKNNNTAM